MTIAGPITPSMRALRPITPINTPFPNVTPFTVRDNATYLMTLEDIVDYIQNDVYPFISENIKELVDSWLENANRVIEEVNKALDAQSEEIEEALKDQIVAFESLVMQIINSSIEVQSPVVAAMLTDKTTDARVALDSILSAVLTEDPADDLLYILNTSPDVPAIIYGNLVPDPDNPGFFKIVSKDA